MEHAIASHLQRVQQQQQQFSQASPSSLSHITAYLEAQRLGALYLHQPSFRLKFLRATLFDASLAAERLFGFLQLVRDVLGLEALMKFPVSLSHFAFDEHSLLREGSFQILPGRDRVGRRVTGIVDDFGPQRSLSAKVRRRCTEVQANCCVQLLRQSLFSFLLICSFGWPFTSCLPHPTTKTPKKRAGLPSFTKTIPPPKFLPIHKNVSYFKDFSIPFRCGQVPSMFVFPRMAARNINNFKRLPWIVSDRKREHEYDFISVRNKTVTHPIVH